MKHKQGQRGGEAGGAGGARGAKELLFNNSVSSPAPLAQRCFPCFFTCLPLSLAQSLLIGLLVLIPTTVLAIPTRVVYEKDAIGSIDIDLKIWKGYGLTINFIPTGEIIKQVWIGDPSRIAFTSNGNLCQKTNDNSNNSNSNCVQGSATVLFLRQITPIKFANLTSSEDGNTQITILTSGSDGQKQYQFKLIPATGQPSYTSLIIKPDSARPLPVIRNKPELVPTKPTNIEQTPPQIPTTNPKISPGSIQRNDANALAYGLAIAVGKGEIKAGSSTWDKAQDAIRLLRRGKSQQEAVSRSGIDSELFKQLMDWGHQ